MRSSFGPTGCPRHSPVVRSPRGTGQGRRRGAPSQRGRAAARLRGDQGQLVPAFESPTRVVHRRSVPRRFPPICVEPPSASRRGFFLMEAIPPISPTWVRRSRSKQRHDPQARYAGGVAKLPPSRRMAFRTQHTWVAGKRGSLPALRRTDGVQDVGRAAARRRLFSRPSKVFIGTTGALV